MTFDQALEALADNQRLTSPSLSTGWVLKLEGGDTHCQHSLVEHPTREGVIACELCPNGPVEAPYAVARVVNEATGSGFTFIRKPEHEAADWNIVQGWASYGG